MELRLTNFIQIRTAAMVLASLISFASFEVRAALVCEQAFVDQVALHSELNLKLERTSELTRNLISIDDDGSHIVSRDAGVAKALLATAQASLDLIQSSGTEAKMIQFDGFPAVEFIAQPRSSSGWNRMASSLLRNYGTRLIFAPHYLHYMKAKSTWQESTKTILVSRESLREGRGERNNLQEFGHMKSALTKEQSPNVFSGFFDVAAPGQVLVPGATEYSTSMELDEVARLAQDLHHLGAKLNRLLKLNGTTESQDARATKSELRTVALRGKEILAIAKTAVAYTLSVSKTVHSGLLGSGPLHLPDGSVDLNRAYVVASNDVQVTIEQKSTGTLRLRLEDNDRSSELWVRGDAAWTTLLAKLQMNDSGAQTEFQSRFKALVQEWEKGLSPSLEALQVSTDGILEGLDSRSNQDLSDLALVPRRIVAPLLRRTSP